MPQRRRWVLEVHLREKHPGVSANALLGPSPLATAAAALATKRPRSPNSKPVKRTRKNSSKNKEEQESVEVKPEKVDLEEQQGQVEYISDTDGDGSLLATLNQKTDKEKNEEEVTHLTLQFTPLTRRDNDGDDDA